MEESDAYDELRGYTLGLGDERFVHQHVVDAWMAQHADERTKPIGLTFALVGLYLHAQRGFSGRQVQRAHMFLARRKRAWPSFPLPEERGSMTAVEVIAAEPGPERNRAIHAWCVSVWESYRESHQAVADLLKLLGEI
jgi:Family of unknown function (DUF5946)